MVSGQDSGATFKRFANGFLENSSEFVERVREPVTPLAQQDYIISKMNEHHGQLQDKQTMLVHRLQEAEIKKSPVDRLSIVEALKDIKGRD